MKTNKYEEYSIMQPLVYKNLSQFNCLIKANIIIIMFFKILIYSEPPRSHVLNLCLNTPHFWIVIKKHIKTFYKKMLLHHFFQSVGLCIWGINSFVHEQIENQILSKHTYTLPIMDINLKCAFLFPIIIDSAKNLQVESKFHEVLIFKCLIFIKIQKKYFRNFLLTEKIVNNAVRYRFKT